MGFKGVHYSELKNQVGFLPVIGKDIEAVFPAFINSVKMLESDNDKNAVYAFLEALGVKINGENFEMNALNVFDVRALSKKYLAANFTKNAIENAGYEVQDEDEVDEIVDKASEIDVYGKRTDGRLAILQILPDYLPEEEEDEEEEEEDYDEEDEDGEEEDNLDGHCVCDGCPHAKKPEEKVVEHHIFTFSIHG